MHAAAQVSRTVRDADLAFREADFDARDGAAHGRPATAATARQATANGPRRRCATRHAA
jgi:hypothetical protein